MCQAPVPPLPCNYINPQDNAIGQVPLPILQMRTMEAQKEKQTHPEKAISEADAGAMPGATGAGRSTEGPSPEALGGTQP